MNTTKTDAFFTFAYFGIARARLTETNEFKHFFCIPHSFLAIIVATTGVDMTTLI